MINFGRHSYICEPYFLRGSENNIIIGNFTGIAESAVFDCGFQHKNYVTTFAMHTVWPELESNARCGGDITIGSDVWIGENCMLMSGITIGDGAIIGARTVVRKNIMPYEVYKGNDLEKQRFRFKKEWRERLLEIAWWNWSDARIRLNMDLLLNGDIDNFINEHI